MLDDDTYDLTHEEVILATPDEIRACILKDYKDGAIPSARTALELLQKFDVLVWPDAPQEWFDVLRHLEAHRAAEDREAAYLAKIQKSQPQRVYSRHSAYSGGGR